MVFAPGKSGNPSGRRRDKFFSDALTLIMVEDPRRARALVHRVINIAIGPHESATDSLRAIEMLWSRLEGKAVQPIEVDVSDELIARPERLARIIELQAKAAEAARNKSNVTDAEFSDASSTAIALAAR